MVCFSVPPVGISTGAFEGSPAEAVDASRAIGCDAIELSALRWREMDPLLELLNSLDLSQFKYVSIHLPSSIPEDSEMDLVRKLEGVTDQRILFVLHPDAVHEFSRWKVLGPRLLIENMDARKRTGRTLEELKTVLEALPQAGLCFDIAHAKQIDPTMTVAARILSGLHDRIRQMHVSDVDSKGAHYRLNAFALGIYRGLLGQLPNVAAIVESPVNASNIKAETQIAKSLMSGGQ
jgi:sugar phosphate isomerase/epimerase